MGRGRITQAECRRSAEKLEALAKTQPHAAVSHKQNAQWWRDAAKVAPK